VTSKDSLAALAKQIEQETGYVNLVVCNSGIMGPIHAALPIGAIPLGGTPGQMTELDDAHELLWNDTYDDWAKTFETNLTGAWFTSIAFLKLLDAGNKRVADKGVYAAKSQIVVISSTDGFLRHGLFSFAYSASKAALTHLAKSMATNFIRWGIRTVCIDISLFFFFFISVSGYVSTWRSGSSAGVPAQNANISGNRTL
jgi:NAD(P)-dependent dehydrogenase (short-subunit alcohol dehydrogenase family)